MKKRAKIFVNEYTNSKYKGYKQPKVLSMSVSTITEVFLLKKRAKIFVNESINFYSNSVLMKKRAKIFVN